MAGPARIHTLLPIAALVAWAGVLSGCYGAYLPDDPGGGSVHVATLPPPPRREARVDCGGQALYLPGEWDWDGEGWVWRSGRCVPSRPGMAYVPPYYAGGVYYRGYWAPLGAAVSSRE